MDTPGPFLWFMWHLLGTWLLGQASMLVAKEEYTILIWQLGGKM